MTDALEPLKELARRWREKKWATTHVSNPLPAEFICADALESLLPALEKMFTEQKREHDLTELEWEKRYVQRGRELSKLEAEIAALKEQLNEEQMAHEEIGTLCNGVGASATEGTSVSAVKDLVAKLEQAKEVEPCGHPIQCLIGDDYGHFTCQWCEQVRLERVAALELASKHEPTQSGDGCMCGVRFQSDEMFEDHILTLCADSDRFALDAYVQERVDRYRTALESIAKNTCCESCQEAALVAKKALNV